LAAPPAAIVTIIPFVYNMLKLHPQCIQMISKEPSLNADGSAISEAGVFYIISVLLVQTGVCSYDRPIQSQRGRPTQNNGN